MNNIPIKKPVFCHSFIIYNNVKYLHASLKCNYKFIPFFSLLAFHRLLTCLEEIRHKLEDREDDLILCSNYFQSRDFRKFFQVSQYSAVIFLFSFAEFNKIILLLVWFTALLGDWLKISKIFSQTYTQQCFPFFACFR